MLISGGPSPRPAPAALFKEIAESGDDVGNYVIVRDRTCYAVLNRYPYTGGHLLVVPYKQTPDLNGLTDEELADLFKLARRCQNALSKVMQPDGFNIGLNLGTRGRGGHPRSRPCPRRSALERRHQFHAGHRQRHRPAGGAGGCGGAIARRPGRIIRPCRPKPCNSKTPAWRSNCSTTIPAICRRWRRNWASKPSRAKTGSSSTAPAEGLEQARELFQSLESSLKNGGAVRHREFAQALNVVKNDGVSALRALFSERIVTSPSKAPVLPKTVGQKKYVDAIRTTT